MPGTLATCPPLARHRMKSFGRYSIMLCASAGSKTEFQRQSQIRKRCGLNPWLRIIKDATLRFTGCCGGLDIFVPNQTCGFRANFGETYWWWAEPGGFDILEVNGRVSGRTRCLNENTFLIKNYEKKCSTTSDNAISNPIEREKLILPVSEKCSKPLILRHFLFHRIEYWNDGFR